MNIEEEIFKKTHVSFDKLEKYGFKKTKNYYTYSKTFMEGSFQAQITIDETGKISGKVEDLEVGEEYTNIRLKTESSFINSVREEYKNILKDIKENCFTENYFIYNQSNRLAEYIIEKYQNKPEFLWDKNPRFGVFRGRNNKWYAIIMNIDKSKLSKEAGEVEVINIKLSKEEISTLLNKKEYYKAYHMNKQSWISIILDDTLDDSEIMNLIDKSYNLVNQKGNWLIPANPKYYDVINHFKSDKTITWKQSSEVYPGDTVYIYLGSPYSSVMFKCEATEVNIPYGFKNENIKMKYIMKLKLLKEYNQGDISFKYLTSLGIKAIRGPRKITEAISQKLN